MHQASKQERADCARGEFSGWILQFRARSFEPTNTTTGFDGSRRFARFERERERSGWNEEEEEEEVVVVVVAVAVAIDVVL